MTEQPAGMSPVSGIAPGTLLREWEVVRLRGRGSYGTVFEARRSSWLDEPPRALKVFDPIVSSSARRSLMAEFEALMGDRHPHLLEGVDAFDLAAGPLAGCVVFVLELADEDLAGRLARQAAAGEGLAPQEVAAIGAEVATGLGELHGRGRVHGDVKPENILRVGERWVLGDFGVSGLLEGSYAVTPGATVDYRPPELAEAEPGDRLHRSTDVWALGVALHVAAAGRHPFPGPDPMMRYAAVVRGDRRPARALAAGKGAQLGALLDEACLQPVPRERASAVGLAARLAAVSGHGPAGEATAAQARPDPVPVEGVEDVEGGVAVRPGGSSWLAEGPVGAVAAAVVLTVAVCNVFGYLAAAWDVALAAQRAAYTLVSLAVVGGVVEPLGRFGTRRFLRVPWPRCRGWVWGATALSWVGTTWVLFGWV